MGFVEAMVIEVSRATTPERPIQEVPFPRFTYDEAMERFGSDKPDLRFGMELVDLAPALAGGSGFRVFDETLAGGGRVKAIVGPGMAGATRRETDELTELAKRFGAKGLVHLAVQADGELHGPDREVPLADDVQQRLVEATGADEGDLILIVADAADTTADVLGRLRVELGGRLGLADPAVLAYCWVHRFPMYKWDAENGRWDATHNPFSGVLPDDEALLVTASGDPLDPVARRPRRAGPGAPVRRRAERLGAGRRVGPDLADGPAREELRAAGLHPGADAEHVRGDARGVRLRRAAPRRDRARHRPLGGAALGPDEHPRGHGVPEDAVRHRPDARGALARPIRRSTRSWASRFVGGPKRAAGGGGASATNDGAAATSQASRPRRPVRPSADAASGPTGMTPVLRLLTADDTAALSAEIARAVEAGDMLASSDPDRVVRHEVVRRSIRASSAARSTMRRARRLRRRPSSRSRSSGPDRRRAGDRPGARRPRPRHRPRQGPSRAAHGRACPATPIGPAFLEATGFAYHSTVWDLDLPPERLVAGAGVAGRSHRAAVRPRCATSSLGSASSTPRSPTTRRRSSSMPQFIAASLDDPDTGRRRLRSSSRRPRPASSSASARPTHSGATGRSATTARCGRSASGRTARVVGSGGSSLRAGVERLRAIGVPNVSLSVNGRNEGALGLYESEGFVRSRTRDRWSRPVRRRRRRSPERPGVRRRQRPPTCPARSQSSPRGRAWRRCWARCASRSRASSTAGRRSRPRPARSIAACSGCRSWPRSRTSSGGSSGRCRARRSAWR